MVGQLLVVSRLEVGELTPRQEVFRAEPLVRRTWDALRDTAHDASPSSRQGLRHLVVADPDRLEQVLWALMDNAVKYSPAGTAGHRSHRVARRARRRRADRRDRGSGCGTRHGCRDRGTRLRAVLPRRCRPAPRARWQRHRPLRRARPGRGDGWQIHVASEPGNGTSITVALPAERADEVADSHRAAVAGTKVRP